MNTYGEQARLNDAWRRLNARQMTTDNVTSLADTELIVAKHVTTIRFTFHSTAMHRLHSARRQDSHVLLDVIITSIIMTALADRQNTCPSITRIFHLNELLKIVSQPGGDSIGKVVRSGVTRVGVTRGGN